MKRGEETAFQSVSPFENPSQPPQCPLHGPVIPSRGHRVPSGHLCVSAGEEIRKKMWREKKREMQPGGGSRSLREHFSGSAPLWVGKLEPQLQGLTAGLRVSLRIYVFLPSSPHFHNNPIGFWGWGLSWGWITASTWPLPNLPKPRAGPWAHRSPWRYRRRLAEATSQSPSLADLPRLLQQGATNTGKALATYSSSSGCFCRSPLHIHHPKMGTSLQRQTLSTFSPSCDTSLCRRDTAHMRSQVSWGCFGVSPP